MGAHNRATEVQGGPTGTVLGLCEYVDGVANAASHPFVVYWCAMRLYHLVALLMLPAAAQSKISNHRFVGVVDQQATIGGGRRVHVIGKRGLAVMKVAAFATNQFPDLGIADPFPLTDDNCIRWQLPQALQEMGEGLCWWHSG